MSEAQTGTATVSEAEIITHDQARPPSAATGWKMVPVEPTDDMIGAVFAKHLGARVFSGTPSPESQCVPTQTSREIYRAMLAASPTPLGSPPVDALVKALEEIASWKECTLGERPSKDDPPLTASELKSQEDFDRGMRMAFYRCADRARAALKLYRGSAS